MNLNEVLSALRALPEDERKQVTQDALKATDGLRFIPNPGPQTLAYFSKADVLLYGGSPGGGKTALEVGLALNEHKRSLIVRRNFVDLDGVLHTLDNILGKQGSAVGGNRPKYRKPDGGGIDFMGLGDDLGGKQGNPHDLICCGLGTPVLMADGTFKPIENVLPGQMVATLEGPRRVLRAFPSPAKPSVRVTARGVSQVQSASHKLLTSVGWVDHRAYVSASQLSTCESTGLRTPRKSCGSSSQTSQPVLRPRVLQSLGLLPQRVWQLVVQGLDRAASLVSAACTGTADQGSACATSGDKARATWLRRVLSAWISAPHQPPLVLVGAARTPFRSALAYAGGDVPRTSAPQDSMGRCSSEPHRGDARTPEHSGLGSAQEGGQQGLLLLADVGPQSPTGSQADGLGTIPRHSRHTWSYDHPYTKGARQSTVGVETVPCEVEQIGEVELFDLEIDEVRHFITAGGFINKNCIDEAAQVPEHQVRMLMGWLRTDHKGQRCRVVMGSNPPLDSVGDWLIDYFAPWLDPQHPNPAADGELRYFLPKEDGVGDIECGPDDFIMMHGVKVTPQSRTFIASKFTDNPFYNPEQYAKALAGLPDSARDKLISGNFMLDRVDDIWQVIPTQWIRAAQDRWTQTPPVGVPMCSLGVDVAQGGADDTVLAARYDGWFAPLIVEPGVKTPTGPDVAGLVLSKRRDACKVVVDIGGGWGADAMAHLKANGVDVESYMGVKQSMRRTKDKLLGFFNLRSQAYWQLREALDPGQEGGSPIMLPPDPKLLAELTAPSYDVDRGQIRVESKDDVVKRLGRSPDRADAVVMAWQAGAKAADSYSMWRGDHRGVRNAPKVVVGYPSRRK